MSTSPQKNRFEEAGSAKSSNLLSEMWAMMKQNKKYWLTPIIIILLLFGLLVILGSSSAAPFIYTLF
jgi:hypothetical protein